MIGNIEFIAYQQIARMTSHIDSVIQEALVTKSELSGQISSSVLASFTGIGRKVDMLV